MIIIRNEKEIKYGNLNSEEQRKFLKKCHAVAMELRFKGDNDSRITFSIQTPRVIQVSIEGKKLKYYNNLFIKKYATEEDRKQYQDYCDSLKQCYDFVMSTKGKSTQNNVPLQVQNLRYSKQKIRQLAHKYCYMIKGMKQEEIEKRFKIHSKYDRILKKIAEIPIDNSTTIIKLLKNANKKDKRIIQALKLRLSGFVISEYSELSLEDKNKLQLEISEKIRLHSDIVTKSARAKRKKAYAKEKEKTELVLLPTAKAMVESFIISNMTIEQFVKKNSIDLFQFKKNLLILKKHEPKKYESYINRTSNIQKQSFNNNIEVVQQILFYIKHGILIDDKQRRPFDLLDYYL